MWPSLLYLFSHIVGWAYIGKLEGCCTNSYAYLMGRFPLPPGLKGKENLGTNVTGRELHYADFLA